MAAYRLLLHIGLMALVTYLIRMLPIALIRRKIGNELFRSFLYYIPYAVLAAMILPDILFATRSVWSGAAALTAGILLALKGQKLLTVAVVACAVVYAAELLLKTG
jgi:branched-subunit amino acid transport protein